jgi:cytochrome c553
MSITPPTFTRVKITALLTLASFFSLTSASAQTTPANTQKIVQSLAATCANCHGTAGYSVGTRLPRLAGQPEADLLAALKGYKDGSRPATVMHQIAKGYTDQQLAQLASYFAAQKK